MEYWEIVKEKEGLTLENLHSADALLKKGENNDRSDSDRNSRDEEDQLLGSDFEGDIDDKIADRPLSVMEEYKEQLGLSMMKRKYKQNKKEFIGWGSKPLMEFLVSIGKDASKQFSQLEVTDIIYEYIHENKLTHPEKKKKVICDARLQSLFRRKSVNRNKISHMLECHFSENQETSEDESGYSSVENVEDSSRSCKRQRKSSSDKTLQKEKVLEAPKSNFAAVVAKNIKLVYLKRSLVEDLLKNPETFEGKVMRSFVKVKSDPNDYSNRNTYQLLEVTGVKESRTGDISTEIILQVSNVKRDVRICMLSDDDFSEEECKNLHQRIKDGLVKRPTVVDLEQKARSLHEDITKHWIVRELALLKNLIARANEKGWRRELYEYLEKRERLQMPSEQARLLEAVPKVIADVIEIEAIPQDCPEEAKQGNDDSPRSILIGASEIPNDDFRGNETASCLMFEAKTAAGNEAVCFQKLVQNQKRESKDEPEHHDDQCIPEENQHQSEMPVSKEHQSEVIVHEGDPRQSNADFAEEQQHQPLEVEEESGGNTHHVDMDEDGDDEGKLNGENASGNQVIDLPEECQSMVKVQEGEPHHSTAYVEEEGENQEVKEESIGKTHLIDIDEDGEDEGQVNGRKALGNQVTDLPEECQSKVTIQEGESHQSAACVEEQQHQPLEVKEESIGKTHLINLDENEEGQGQANVGKTSENQVIDLSDDDDDLGDATGNWILNDSIWNYVDPLGSIQGPFSISMLKRWSDSNYFGPEFKVWKIGESQEAAILLTDALSQMFPEDLKK